MHDRRREFLECHLVFSQRPLRANGVLLSENGTASTTRYAQSKTLTALHTIWQWPYVRGKPRQAARAGQLPCPECRGQRICNRPVWSWIGPHNGHRCTSAALPNPSWMGASHLMGQSAQERISSHGRAGDFCPRDLYHSGPQASLRKVCVPGHRPAPRPCLPQKCADAGPCN